MRPSPARSSFSRGLATEHLHLSGAARIGADAARRRRTGIRAMLSARDLGVRWVGAVRSGLPDARGAASRRFRRVLHILGNCIPGMHDPTERRTMSVRQSLLAILDQGPCYGYQLRAEFDRRTGSTWPLNVGPDLQHARPPRARRARREGRDRRRRGTSTTRSRMPAPPRSRRGSPLPSSGGTATRDELAVKIAVAATLPGVDVGALLQRSSAASRARSALTPLDPNDGRRRPTSEPEELARALVVDAMILHAEAELRWLDRVEAAPGAASGACDGTRARDGAPQARAPRRAA